MRITLALEGRKLRYDQPMYGQLLSLLDKARILKISRETGGERYIKHFDAWQRFSIYLVWISKKFGYSEQENFFVYHSSKISSE